MRISVWWEVALLIFYSALLKNSNTDLSKPRRWNKKSACKFMITNNYEQNIYIYKYKYIYLTRPIQYNSNHQKKKKQKNNKLQFRNFLPPFDFA